MLWDIVQGISVPFLGTSLGAACVFFLRNRFSGALRRSLTGFAAGVMTASSVWSLLLPAIEGSSGLGRWAFLPAAAGFWAGVLRAPGLFLQRLTTREPDDGQLEVAIASLRGALDEDSPLLARFETAFDDKVEE